MYRRWPCRESEAPSESTLPVLTPLSRRFMHHVWSTLGGSGLRNSTESGEHASGACLPKWSEEPNKLNYSSSPLVSTWVWRSSAIWDKSEERLHWILTSKRSIHRGAHLQFLYMLFISINLQFCLVSNFKSLTLRDPLNPMYTLKSVLKRCP